MQARLSAAFEGAPFSSAAGGNAAAALAASLSAFSASSASRTSLVTAPRSGCCSRSLARSGLKPRSGSASAVRARPRGGHRVCRIRTCEVPQGARQHSCASACRTARQV
eukprot:scaffold33453_cov53-Phaeocystis_antarctica.AAC.1